MPLLWTADWGMGMYFTPWWALRGYEIHTHGHRLWYHCWLYWLRIKVSLPFSCHWGRISLYNGPPSKPHVAAFYDMQAEGCLLLPISSTILFYIDLRPEAGSVFLPSKGTGYWIMSVLTMETFDEEECERNDTTISLHITKYLYLFTLWQLK